MEGRGEFQPGRIGIEDVAEQREHRAEVILRFLRIAKDIAPLHGHTVDEAFGDEESRRQLLEEMDEKDFTDLLSGINGILRDKPKEEWAMDGRGVALESAFGDASFPPRFEDKTVLLGTAFCAAKQMSKSGRSTEDIALLLSSSINAIHPYMDGNGRTSRLLYLLMTEDEGAARQEYLRAALNEDGRDIINIDPSHIEMRLRNLLEREIGFSNPKINEDNITNMFWEGTTSSLPFDKSIDEAERKEFISAIKKDEWTMCLAVFEFIREKSFDGAAGIVQKYPNRSVIRIDSLLGAIDSSNFRDVLEHYHGLKKRKVEKMIDCIAQPDKDEYRIEMDGRSTNILHDFKSRVLSARPAR